MRQYKYWERTIPATNKCIVVSHSTTDFATNHPIIIETFMGRILRRKKNTPF